MPNLFNFLQQKKALLGLVALLLILTGVIGGVYLATGKKRLTLFTKATPLTASSGIANLNGTPATQLICEQDYLITSQIQSPYGQNTDNQQIKDQRAWINFQGTNAGQYRGQFRWVYNISMVPAGQTAYPCKCGNANQCLPNAPNSIAGYIWLENDKNADLVPYIELLPLYPTMTPPRYCEAWNNYSTDPLEPYQNHVFVAKIKVKTQWAIDGPNTLNDISTFAVNLAGQSIGWVNNDANYSISCSLPTPAPSASASPGPTATPIATPLATPDPTPAVSPTPLATPLPSPIAQCENIKYYRVQGNLNLAGSWLPLTLTDLQALRPGDVFYVTTSGSVQFGTFDRARIRVNSNVWTPADETYFKKPPNNPSDPIEFFISYSIPDGVTTFTFSAEIHEQDQNKWY